MMRLKSLVMDIYLMTTNNGGVMKNVKQLKATTHAEANITKED